MVKKTAEKLKTFTTKSKRVWHSLKKPSKEEFWMVTKVSAAGIGILGFVGFLISIILGIFK